MSRGTSRLRAFAADGGFEPDGAVELEGVSEPMPIHRYRAGSGHPPSPTAAPTRAIMRTR